MHKEFSHQYYIIKNHSVPYPSANLLPLKVILKVVGQSKEY